MEKELIHSIGKHEFKVIYDKDAILKKIAEEREDYCEKAYQRYGQVGYEDGYLSQEDYEKNLEEMISTLEEITTEESLVGFIVDAQKKKNGTFYKGRIIFRKGCDNTEFITEWHNTWIYNALNVSAVNDTILLLDYIRITDTPG